jgi:hypothetical protein
MSDELSEKTNNLKTIGNPREGQRGPGRPKGLQNKATMDFKAAVNRLLESSTPQMVDWLQQVADGNVADGGKREPDPGKALDLLAKLAEFAAPKLSRAEVTGVDGAPVNMSLKVEFINGPTA